LDEPACRQAGNLKDRNLRFLASLGMEMFIVIPNPVVWDEESEGQKFKIPRPD
jgi:hypothetical protein